MAETVRRRAETSPVKLRTFPQQPRTFPHAEKTIATNTDLARDLPRSSKIAMMIIMMITIIIVIIRGPRVAIILIKEKFRASGGTGEQNKVDELARARACYFGCRATLIHRTATDVSRRWAR